MYMNHVKLKCPCNAIFLLKKKTPEMCSFRLIGTLHVILKRVLLGLWGEDRRQNSRVQGGECVVTTGLPLFSCGGRLAVGDLAHLLYCTSVPAHDSLSVLQFAAAVKCGVVATPLPRLL